MTSGAPSIDTHSPEETANLAVAIGRSLRMGDTILLNGEIGAGKSLFARHLIQSRQDKPEDVPSPTFTLVQIYDIPGGTIWHADLYRITSSFELEELGLEEAFETEICLVEWPDRMGEFAPPNALTIDIERVDAKECARRFNLSWSDPRWASRLKEVLIDTAK